MIQQHNKEIFAASQDGNLISVEYAGMSGLEYGSVDERTIYA